jgi:hypothetical protein
VLLLMKAGTERRRLSAMKRTRELVGREIGLIEMPAEVAREIIREQSYIVEFEPERALATLPKLLTGAEDRRITLELLERLEGHIEPNAEQTALFGEIRGLLGQESVIALRAPDPTAQRVEHGTTRRPRNIPRTRASS